MGDFIQADQAMTFRDKSADTTLDNANMGMREDFEKWAVSKGFPVPSIYNSHTMEDIHQAWVTWQARQPEIDALKDSLHRAINDARNFCKISLNNWSEIQRLKAENERLRADAERYKWLRRNTGAIVLHNGEGEFAFPSHVTLPCSIEDVFEFGPAKHLDDAIDAMKDFSTTQKEEECDN